MTDKSVLGSSMGDDPIMSSIPPMVEWQESWANQVVWAKQLGMGVASPRGLAPANV